VNLPACPPAGAGVHSWVLAAANYCRLGGLTPAAAGDLIAGKMTRAPSPANEIVTAIRKAYDTPYFSGSFNRHPARVPLGKIQYEPKRLQTFASRISAPDDWAQWLRARSPKLPETQNAFSFLKHLYAPGETLLVFDRMKALKPTLALRISDPMDCRVPEYISSGGSGAGIWFLANPVDGLEHNGSVRNHECVTTFRYAVFESDVTPAKEFLALIVQLPLRIAAIYTSGGRSVHALVRLDAKSKEDFNSQIDPLKRPLKALGVDPATLSAVRLSRLPGCARPQKSGFQTLLYLNSNPAVQRLKDAPELREPAALAAAGGRKDSMPE
jgi:hypothetical protein